MSRRKLKEAIYSAMFDMNVPAVCAVSQVFSYFMFSFDFITRTHITEMPLMLLLHSVQATLALFAARKTSGILVNVGFNQTSVVPSMLSPAFLIIVVSACKLVPYSFMLESLKLMF